MAVCEYHQEIKDLLVDNCNKTNDIHDVLLGTLKENKEGKQGAIAMIFEHDKFIKGCKRSAIYIISGVVAGGGAWVWTLIK